MGLIALFRTYVNEIAGMILEESLSDEARSPEIISKRQELLSRLRRERDMTEKELLRRLNDKK